MKYRLFSLVVTLVVLILFQTGADGPSACGPFGSAMYFWFHNRPSTDFVGFAGGEIGVIQPTWASSYLLVAYRYLDGMPLTGGEQQDMVALWERRLHTPRGGQGALGEKPDPVTVWIDWHNRLTNECPRLSGHLELDIFRRPQGGESWERYRNCGDDAFRNATLTLGSLAATWGAGSPAVCDWLEQQDRVFSNCSGGFASIPSADGDSEPKLLPYRAYQMAAADFYAERWTEAHWRFLAIGNDKSSPWRDIGPHLAIRSLLRKAQVGNGGDVDEVTLEEARRELIELRADPVRGAGTPRAHRFLDFLVSRLLPAERVSACAEAIMMGSRENSLGQLADDYTTLLTWGRWRLEPVDPMTRWMSLLGKGERKRDWERSKREEARAEAVALWRSEGRVTWLVAALINSRGSEGDLGELLQAAASEPETSPAWPTLLAERLRLGMPGDSGSAMARSALERGVLTPQAENVMASLLLERAETLEDIIRFLPRRVLCFNPYGRAGRVACSPTWSPHGEETPVPETMLDNIGIDLVNNVLPLDHLQRLLEEPNLDRSIRAEIGRVAWTRAVLLGDHARGVSLARSLAPLDPRLENALKRYSGEATDGGRHRTALDILLWFQDLTPFIQGGRALTNEARRRVLWHWRQRDWNRLVVPVPLPFLDEKSTDVLRDELSGLEEPVSDPAVYLCREVIRWAKEAPDDPRVAPALFRAIRATFYARQSDEVGRWSQKAFKLLHDRYPQSKWARKTPFWFRGR